MIRILAGILAGCSLYAQPAPSTLTVTTLADSGPGSLRQAIANANAETAPSRITFAAGLHGAIVLTTGALALARSTEIDGPGAESLSVSGDNAGRVFEIESTANITIQRLSIVKGSAAGNVAHPGLGGGIYVAGGALTLNLVTLANNRAIGTPNSVSEIPAGTGPPNMGAGGGGGIYIAAGTLTITNSVFVNNQALGAGGSAPGMSAGMSGGGLGGGIFNQAGSLTLTNTTFVNNQTLGGNGGEGASGGAGFGGGIFNSSGTLTATGIVLTGNQATGGSGGAGGNGGAGLGGGIMNTGQSTFSASWVLANFAQGGNPGAGGTGGSGSGGGIYTGSGGVVVLQDDFILASNAALGWNCGFPGCGANAGNAFGGGIYGATNSVVTIRVARIVGNRATGATGIGGGIYVVGTLTLSSSAIVAGNFASTADPNIFPPGV